MRVLFLVLVSAILCSTIVSCSKDYTGKEKTHPVFVKAGTARNSGDYAEAAKLYEEFLLVAPKSAETHMQLAALYGDNLDSPLKAIYHYEKVIELRPDDTVNNDNIRSFISVARKKLFDQLKTSYRDIEKENALSAELDKTKQQLNAYKEYSAKLLARYRACLDRLRVYMRQGRRQAPAKQTAAPAAKKSTVKNTVPAAKKVAGTKVPAAKKSVVTTKTSGKILGKHIVKRGENLHSIARKYYGNAKYYKLIAEANKGKLPANLGVRIGQELVIPQKNAK